MIDNIKTIHSIELENFKGYRCSETSPRLKFDLSVDGEPADLILVTGKNGVGKTSLLEAISWVLNQSESPSGSLKTTGALDGAVTINGTRFTLNGEGKPDPKKLLPVASFFYQENISDLAFNEIIQRLEPEYKPAEKIKQDLKILQGRLEEWQRQLHKLKYRKNYDEERKAFAKKINDLITKLPQDSLLRKALVDSTLTLNNGNLQSRWESQIRNLSSSIRALSNLVEPVGVDLPGQLDHIGYSLLEYQVTHLDPTENGNIPSVFSKAFLASIQALPESFPVAIGVENSASLELEGALIIGLGADVYRHKIYEMEQKRDELATEYRRLNQLVEHLDNGDDSLVTWINKFNLNIDVWLAAWENHPDKDSVSELNFSIENKLKSFLSLATSRAQEIRIQIGEIASNGQLASEKLNNLIRLQSLARDSGIIINLIPDIMKESNLTIGRLSQVISEYMEATREATSDQSAISEAEISHKLGMIFRDWAKLETEKKEDEINVTDLKRIEQAEKIASDALAICKQESGAKNQLLSVIGGIPQAELEQLLHNMNKLLASFHFPEDFLPIKIVKSADRIPRWSFETNSKVKFDDLSTGQKTQVAICWTINLNLALSHQLGHQVIGFDDFTTSLDMNQLIPASVLLRKLAYADNNDSWKRQVIVTSHHEDLTNRLIDFLLPPPGRRMKVIQFENWLPETGPECKCYNVDMGSVREDGLSAAVTRIVKETA